MVPNTLVPDVRRAAPAGGQAGKRCAVHANGASYAARIAGQGYDLVTVWVDVVAISSSLAEAERAWTAATRQDPG